ncbi:uncharacterized protein LOC116849068 [Odontomachus brunneus]|uniref:uncharacterized protein LOC116849068 n=1 Tax=Odontomachus brunneus TaxID=486640 RepID=UPI0013F267C5|nr:uncharacterized protein LOC116849068 [Odontomachus brunneus]
MQFHHILLLSLVSGAYSLLGYDCSGKSLNVSTISLLGIGECHFQAEKVNSISTYIQLLQVTDYPQTKVISCRVEINRRIFYCGMHSHFSLVQGDHHKYLVDLDQGACDKLHRTRSFSYGTESPVVDLFPNTTNYRSLILAGTISVDGSCHGSQFSDPYGTWNDVVVEAFLSVIFWDYYASTKTSQNLLILKSGTHCRISDLTCIDEDGANVYWAPLPSDACRFHSYDVLYQGLATKIFDASSHYPLVYSITSQETTVALSKTSERSLCGYTLVQTEHPKLIIVETSKDNSFAEKSEIVVDNLDAFTYINSKFVYVEKYTKTQIQNLYENIILQKCHLEQQILKNAVFMAQSQPDLFAYTLMKGPGYFAFIAGEVAHIIKCVPTEVVQRSTKECFLELPILLNNQSLFLSPKTHVIVKSGTPIECNPLFPVMYQLRKEEWVNLTSKQAAVSSPQCLEPMVKFTWKYAESGNSDDLNLMERMKLLKKRLLEVKSFLSVIKPVLQVFPNSTFKDVISSLIDDISSLIDDISSLIDDISPLINVIFLSSYININLNLFLDIWKLYRQINVHLAHYNFLLLLSLVFGAYSLLGYDAESGNSDDLNLMERMKLLKKRLLEVKSFLSVIKSVLQVFPNSTFKDVISSLIDDISSLIDDISSLIDDISPLINVIFLSSYININLNLFLDIWKLYRQINVHLAHYNFLLLLSLVFGAYSLLGYDAESGNSDDLNLMERMKLLKKRLLEVKSFLSVIKSVLQVFPNSTFKDVISSLIDDISSLIDDISSLIDDISPLINVIFLSSYININLNLFLDIWKLYRQINVHLAHYNFGN